MNRIILLRHSKSTHTETGLVDFNRSLSTRGIEEALAVGKWLKQNKFQPQTLYTSLAIRCVHTCTIVMQILRIKYDNLIAMSDLYETNEEQLVTTIRETEDKTKTILLCNHNPLLDDVVKKVVRDDDFQFTTGSIAVFNYNSTSWLEFDFKKCSLEKMFINQKTGSK